MLKIWKVKYEVLAAKCVRDKFSELGYVKVSLVELLLFPHPPPPHFCINRVVGFIEVQSSSVCCTDCL